MTSETPVHFLSPDDSDVRDIEPHLFRRIAQTIACEDADDVPKVPGAGEVFDHAGVKVQRMFNGLLVEEGCYFGDLITPIITRLRGHHEPQEERVLDAVFKRLRDEQDRGELKVPVSIEFGAFWSFYSMWFVSELEGARAVGSEPEPARLEVGRRNVALNGLADRVELVPGVVGGTAGTTVSFAAESDGQTYEVPVHDVDPMLEVLSADRAEIVFCDIQGFEVPLLEASKDVIARDGTRFWVISTHHRSISGSAVTHQRVLELVHEYGGHVVAEHSVAESCSGDGLVVASFDARDRDFTVEISHVRSKDSLFGELEVEVDEVCRDRDNWASDHRRLVRECQVLQQRLEESTASVEQLTARVSQLTRKSRRLRRELVTLRSSTTWRIGRLVTGPLGRLKSR